jgi:malate dehydrogenase
MTREELIGTGIVKMVVDNVLIHSPEAIVVVSNHDDVFGFENRIAKKQNHRNGGALDSSRFRTYLSIMWVNQQMIFQQWLLEVTVILRFL